MSFPICGHTAGSNIPRVPGVFEDRLCVLVREIGASDRCQSERGHRHGFSSCHAARKESASISRRLGDDGYTQNR